MRLELPIEVFKDDAGLDGTPARSRVEVDDSIEMLGAIQNEPGVDGLSALRRATAARRHRYALVDGDLNRVAGLID